MPLGDNIKRFRELQNLSIPALAEKMGIGKAGIYKWESGENKPGQESLTALAQALKVSVSDLLDENPTSVDKRTDNKEKSVEEVYREWLEGSGPYRLIPKSILDEQYRIVLVSEIESKDKLLNEVLTVQRALIEQLKSEIASLRSQPVSVMHPK
jgi:transcriptional regulator with XRE-family HTH domain